MTTKYKLQVPSANGWSDIKATSDNGLTYEDDHYSDKSAAEKEGTEMFGRVKKQRWRAVASDTLSADDLYPSSLAVTNSL